VTAPGVNGGARLPLTPFAAGLTSADGSVSKTLQYGRVQWRPIQASGVSPPAMKGKVAVSSVGGTGSFESMWTSAQTAGVLAVFSFTPAAWRLIFRQDRVTISWLDLILSCNDILLRVGRQPRNS